MIDTKEKDLRDLVKLCRAIEAEVLAGVVDPQEHDYYGAGEPDCPREIKGANGELHTLQCRFGSWADLPIRNRTTMRME